MPHADYLLMLYVLGLWLLTVLIAWIAVKYKSAGAGWLAVLLAVVSLASTCGPVSIAIKP
jgi:hypothetical protein